MGVRPYLLLLITVSGLTALAFTLPTPWAGAGEEPARTLSAFFVATVSAEALDSLDAAFDEHLQVRRRKFPQLRMLTAREKRALRRSRNERHLEVAGHMGEHHSAEPEVLEARGVFLRLDRAAHYYVIHDNPGVLTPDAAAALDVIGARFHAELAAAGLPPLRFTVSSTYRSGSYQRRLRRRNRNATGGVSSHEFGTTFDLSYRRYAVAAPGTHDPGGYRTPAHLPAATRALLDARYAERERVWAGEVQEEYAWRLQAVLGRALIGLEDEGALLALREWRQPCFHITVAERLAGQEV